MPAPNLVIAGTVKGGTTSLFRYLAMHPDVCASRVKETCYFLPVRYKDEPLAPWEDYLAMFDHCTGQKIVVEATPGYFEGGRELATELKARLGDNVKVLISFRNPAERLLSYYQFKQAQLELPGEMSLPAYIDACESMPFEEKAMRDNRVFWGIEGGKYSRYLPGWLDVFPPESLKIVFFDDIARHPAAVMTDICQWLGIDPDFYAHTALTAENRTVQYRNAWLQKLAILANRKLEPLLRLSPGIRQGVRKLYYALNGRQAPAKTVSDLDLVKPLYQDDLSRLASQLRARGYTQLPSWLG